MFKKLISILPIKLQRFIQKFLDTSSNKKIVTHAFWSLLGAVFSKILVLLSTMVVARTLGKEEYGQLGIINSTILMFVAFAGFGIGSTASKFIAENRDNNPERAIDIYLISNGFSGILGIILSTLILFFAPSIAQDSLNAPELVNEIRLGSVIFLFSILNGAQIGTLAGFEDFKAIAVSNVLKALTQVVFIIFGAKYFGLMGAVLGFGISFVVAWIVNFIYVKKHINKINISLISRIEKLTLDKFDVLWQFSLPAAVSSLIMPPAIWWAKTLLVRENGFEAMATFDVAEQWRAQILFIPGVLATIILPVLASNKATDSKKDFLNTIKTNLILNVSIATLLSIVIFFTGDIILAGYGNEFTNAFPLYILALSAILISVSNVVFPILMTYNKIWFGVLINMIWAICLILIAKIFIKIGYAEDGLALAIFISYFVSLFLQVFYVRYLIKIKS
jgi:O-antigen/teichoic acid export membrane protein